MLWVLNLFSRSSSTKLWKQIFKRMSQFFFFTLKVGKWWDCLILTPWERSNLSKKFRWKLFFERNFYVHWMNAHMCIIQRLWKTSKNVFPLVVNDPKSVYLAIKDQKNFDEKKIFIEISDSNLTFFTDLWRILILWRLFSSAYH